MTSCGVFLLSKAQQYYDSVRCKLSFVLELRLRRRVSTLTLGRNITSETKARVDPQSIVSSRFQIYPHTPLTMVSFLLLLDTQDLPSLESVL
jgi:hypothetical protein